MRQALYGVPQADSKVQCLLCPHGCLLSEGERGRCGARQNIAGQLKVLNYGQVTALALDPLEKKPLQRFMPGKLVLSLGTWGCNFRCSFCQNWQIAQQGEVAASFLSPEAAVAKALEFVPQGNIGIAYTYSEPLIWYEYVRETARLAQEAGLSNILVTNGYLNPQPLRDLLPFIDAVNLDIKAFTNDFYEDFCEGQLAPVLKNAELFAAHCHLEITTLLIPGLNDSLSEIKELSQRIAQIDPQIPLHLSRYFPNYKLKIPATPRQTMCKAQEVAQQHLAYVYLGNF